MHSVGIVHRDLKPENLLYATNVEHSPSYNVIKVADFGLAKVLSGANEACNLDALSSKAAVCVRYIVSGS